jgi:hypothetical protein
MHSAQSTSLLLWSCLLVALCQHPSLADPTKKKPAQAPRAAWSTRVEGVAPEKDVAEGIALIHAQDELGDYLSSRNPHVAHVPSKDYILQHLVKERFDAAIPESERRDEKEKYRVVLEVGVTDKDYSNLLVFERQTRARGRMLDLGKVLAGLIAVLAAVSLYFRLEETTKGYYTAWLRLGAIGFVGAVGIGIWLVS